MPNLPSKPKSQTDWERVKRDYASDLPIPFNPNEELYDPNDEQAASAAWATGKVTFGVRGSRRQKVPTRSLQTGRIKRQASEDVQIPAPLALEPVRRIVRLLG